MRHSYTCNIESTRAPHRRNLHLTRNHHINVEAACGEERGYLQNLHKWWKVRMLLICAVVSGLQGRIWCSARQWGTRADLGKGHKRQELVNAKIASSRSVEPLAMMKWSSTEHPQVWSSQHEPVKWLSHDHWCKHRTTKSHTQTKTRIMTYTVLCKRFEQYG